MLHLFSVNSSSTMKKELNKVPESPDAREIFEEVDHFSMNITFSISGKERISHSTLITGSAIITNFFKEWYPPLYKNIKIACGYLSPEKGEIDKECSFLQSEILNQLQL